ncbi:MAG: hypothetical protein WBB85_06175 [Albidovulum sp.]
MTEKQHIWLKHVDDCTASGVSMRAYADRHGLDVQRFYVWKSQLKQLGVLAHNRAKSNDIDQPPPSALSPLIRAQVVSRPSGNQQQPTMCAARVTLANGKRSIFPFFRGAGDRAHCRAWRIVD